MKHCGASVDSQTGDGGGSTPLWPEQCFVHLLEPFPVKGDLDSHMSFLGKPLPRVL